MLKVSFQLIQELQVEYKAPKNKLLSLEKEGKLFKVVKGLYETDRDTSPFLLSSAIYGPSYISFETALSYWSLIPEKVVTVMSATFGKNKTKTFNTSFGLFLYRDVPKTAYPYEVYIMPDGNRNFLIAGKEKCLCDTLYREKPLASEKQLCKYMFDNLRIEEDDFYSLNSTILLELAGLYKSTNLKLLQTLIQKHTKDMENKA